MCLPKPCWIAGTVVSWAPRSLARLSLRLTHKEGDGPDGAEYLESIGVSPGKPPGGVRGNGDPHKIKRDKQIIPAG